MQFDRAMALFLAGIPVQRQQWISDGAFGWLEIQFNYPIKCSLWRNEYGIVEARSTSCVLGPSDLTAGDWQIHTSIPERFSKNTPISELCLRGENRYATNSQEPRHD